MLSAFFKLRIEALISLLVWVVGELNSRAAEKIESGREEEAKELLAEADRERAEAKLAASTADKLAKLLK